jgi:hypothetical protein
MSQGNPTRPPYRWPAGPTPPVPPVAPAPAPPVPPVVPAPAPALWSPPLADQRLRASNADRSRYADFINEAYAAGQLDDAELSARLDAALSAKTLGDLSPLVADLNLGALTPVAPPSTKALATPARPRRRLVQVLAIVLALAVVVAGGQAIARTIGDKFGGPGITSNNRDQALAYSGSAAGLPPEISASMGDSTVDLSQVVVDTDATVAVNTSMGDITVRLPVDANVVLTYAVSMGDISFNGGTDVKFNSSALGRSGTHTWTPHPGQYVLTINLNSSMGDVKIV